MSRNQRLNATLTIGAALQASVRRNLDVVGRGLRRVGDEIDTVKRRQADLGRQREVLIRQGQSVAALDREYQQLNETLRRLEDRQRRLRNVSGAMGQVGGAFGNMTREIGSAARRATLAIGAVGTALYMGPVRTAADFEQSMARVGAVSRASEEDLAALTATARELGATTNFSASQAAEGMQYLAMAGFSATQTIEAMPGMLALASAGAAELAETADIASNILSGFGLQASEMGRVGDVLTNTFTTSNTDLAMLGATMKYVAPVAATFGASIEDVAAMAGKLGDAGIQGEMAGTALRAMFIRLASPAKAGSDALAELGVSTQDAAGNMRPLADILADIDAAMSDLGSADRGRIGSAIFGMEAVSAATVLMGQAGSGALQDYTKALEESGSAARVAAQQNQTLQGALRRLGSVWEGVMITIGTELLPIVTDGLNQISDAISENREAIQQFAVRMADGIRNAMPAIGEAVRGLGEVATTVGQGVSRLAEFAGGWDNLAIAVGALFAGNAIASVLGFALAIGKLTVAVGALAAPAVLPAVAVGIRAIGLAMAANPIGAAITAIAMAATLVMTNWSEIRPKLQPIIDWFNAAVEYARDNVVAPFFEGIQRGVQLGTAAWQRFRDGLGAIIDWLGERLQWLLDKLEPILNAGAKLREIGQGVGDRVGRAGNWVAGLFSDDEEEAQDPERPQARAVGGSFLPGALLVGEKGPEARFEDRAGFIATNRQLRDMAANAASIRGVSMRGLDRAAEGARQVVANLGGITINAAPGMDPQAIAQAVRREFERMQRSALYDRPALGPGG